MYLKTPKKYSGKRTVHLFNFKWLWLYILAPVVILSAVLVWDFRGELIPKIISPIQNAIRKAQAVPLTPTPIIAVDDLRKNFENYRTTGQIKNAISTLGSLAETAPNDLNVHTTLVEMLALRGGYDTPDKLQPAIDAAQKAVNADPEQAMGWVVLAMALDKAGKPDQALVYALHARDIDDKNSLMLSVLAEIEIDLENYDQAAPLIDQAIKTANSMQPINLIYSAYAHWVNGVLLSNSNGDAATREFEKAWQVADSDTSKIVPTGFIVEQLAVSYLTDSNKDHTLIDILTKASDRDKDNPMIPYLLGRVYYKQSDVAKTQTYFSQCLDLDPERVKCLRWLSQLLYGQGNYVKAAEYAQRAIDNGSTEPEAYLLAGRAYAESPEQRCDLAVGILQKALTLTEQSANTEARKNNLRTQIEDGLHICNAGIGVPEDTPTPGTAATAAPTLKVTPTAKK